METKIFNHLRDLGMGSNEAKVYLSLLKSHPSTGYQIARNSGVRRAMIYEILRSLAQRGAIFSVNAKISRYMPVKPDEFLRSIQDRSQETYSALRKHLSHFKTAAPEQSFMNLQGYDRLMDKANSMIRSARQKIHISGRKREIELLHPGLANAVKKKLEVCLFSFSQISGTVGKVYSHNVPEEKLDRVPDFRRLTVVTDSSEVLIGEAEEGEETIALWTKNISLVQLAREHITHDIYLVKIWQKFGSKELNRILAQEDRVIAEYMK